MSETLAKWAKLTGKLEKKDSSGPPLGEEESKALAKLQELAKQSGATLASDGKGGLPPSLVLGVMKRDRFTCKVCGLQEDIGVHHKGGVDHPGSKWLAKKGHQNTPDNLVTICDACHDNVHEQDRAEGETGFEEDKAVE